MAIYCYTHLSNNYCVIFNLFLFRLRVRICVFRASQNMQGCMGLRRWCAVVQMRGLGLGTWACRTPRSVSTVWILDLNSSPFTRYMRPRFEVDQKLLVSSKIRHYQGLFCHNLDPITISDGYRLSGRVYLAWLMFPHCAHWIFFCSQLHFSVSLCLLVLGLLLQCAVWFLLISKWRQLVRVFFLQHIVTKSFVLMLVPDLVLICNYIPLFSYALANDGLPSGLRLSVSSHPRLASGAACEASSFVVVAEIVASNCAAVIIAYTQPRSLASNSLHYVCFLPWSLVCANRFVCSGLLRWAVAI